MSACSLTADLLSKCTWNVPFTYVWVQEIVDTAVATHPVTVFPMDLSPLFPIGAIVGFFAAKFVTLLCSLPEDHLVGNGARSIVYGELSDSMWQWCVSNQLK